MPFDIEAARSAKKTDTEIANYLAGKYNFDAESARASGKTDTQIAEYLSKYNKPTTPLNDTEGMSTMQKGLAGLGGGLYMTGKGIQQKGAQLGALLNLVNPETVNRITQEGEGARTDLSRLTDQSTAAEIGKFIGETAPAMAIPGGVAGGLLKRIGTSALAGAGQGAARFTGKDESSIQNAVAGGVMGAAVPAALAPISKLANAARGAVTKTPARVLAESKGVPTTLGEDLMNPHLQKMEILMERLPIIGTSAFRKRQHAAAEGMANKYLAGYVADGVEGSRGMLERNRAVVSKIYEGVKTKYKGFEDLKAYALDTAKTANEISDTWPMFWEKFGNQKIMKMVKDFQSGTGNIHSFDDLWELRKGVGDIVDQSKKMLRSGGVSKEQYAMASKMYSAINNDMDAFAVSIGKPELSKAMQVANDAYKQHVVKYNIIDRAMDKATGQVVEGVSTGKPFSPLQFSTALDKILKDEKYGNLFTRAEKMEMAGTASILNAVKASGQYMANPPTGNRIVELLLGQGAIGTATTMMTNPATGLATTSAATGVPLIARFLTTTKAGKDLSIAASKLKSNSPIMQKLIDQAYKGASRMSVNESLNLLNPSQKE